MAILTDVIQRGTRAAQPLATVVPAGTLYFVTDESVTEQSNGTTWLDYSDGGGGSGLDQLTGDVTAGPGTGSQVATIAANAVSNTKLRDSAALSIIGRATNSSGDPADIVTAVAGEVLKRIGTTLGFSLIGVPQIVIANSDESDSDNTVHDDAELLFPVNANEVYIFEAFLMFTTGTSTTPDVKVGWTLPASATLTEVLEGLAVAATSADGQWTYRAQYQNTTPVTARATGVISTATEAVTPVIIRGVIRISSTAGNIQLQWAQNTTTGGTPTVRKADSFIKFTRIA